MILIPVIVSQVDSKENSNVLNERIVDKFFKYESHLWYDTLSKKVRLAYLSMAAEHLDKGSDATSLMKESLKDWDDMTSALACASSHRVSHTSIHSSVLRAFSLL